MNTRPNRLAVFVSFLGAASVLVRSDVQQTNTTPIRLLPMPPHAFDVAFSPDGVHVLVGGAYGQAKLWETATGREVKAFQGFNPQSEERSVVAFSADGSRVLTAQAESQSALLWKVDSGTIGRAFTTLSPNVPGLIDAALSPDGNIVVTCDLGEDAIHVWDTLTGRQTIVLQGHLQGPLSAAFSPDGSRLATGGNPIGTFSPLRIWEVPTWQSFFSIPHQGKIHSVAFSSDGVHLLTVDQEAATGEGLAVLWNAASGARLQTFHHGPAEALAAAIAPDGSLVFTGGNDGCARLFDRMTGELIAVFQLEGDTSPVPAVAFSPDGRLLLTAHTSGSAALWETPADEISILVVTLPGGSFRLTWPSPTGGPGTVLQRCADLEQPEWEDVEVVEPGSFQINPPLDAQVFFRLRIDVR